MYNVNYNNRYVIKHCRVTNLLTIATLSCMGTPLYYPTDVASFDYDHFRGHWDEYTYRQMCTKDFCSERILECSW